MSEGFVEAERLLSRASRAAALGVLAVAVPLSVTLRGGRALALGLIVGGAASILRYRLRYRALIRLRESGAGALVRARLLGYVLSGVALAAAFVASETISPWTTIAGLFVMNGCILAFGLLSGHGELAEGKRATDEGG